MDVQYGQRGYGDVRAGVSPLLGHLSADLFTDFLQKWLALGFSHEQVVKMAEVYCAGQPARQADEGEFSGSSDLSSRSSASSRSSRRADDYHARADAMVVEPGCSYLAMIRPSFRGAVKRKLGAAPRFLDLFLDIPFEYVATKRLSMCAVYMRGNQCYVVVEDKPRVGVLQVLSAFDQQVPGFLPVQWRAQFAGVQSVDVGLSLRTFFTREARPWKSDASHDVPGFDVETPVGSSVRSTFVLPSRLLSKSFGDDDAEKARGIADRRGFGTVMAQLQSAVELGTAGTLIGYYGYETPDNFNPVVVIPGTQLHFPRGRVRDLRFLQECVMLIPSGSIMSIEGGIQMEGSASSHGTWVVLLGDVRIHSISLPGGYLEIEALGSALGHVEVAGVVLRYLKPVLDASEVCLLSYDSDLLDPSCYMSILAVSDGSLASVGSKQYPCACRPEYSFQRHLPSPLVAGRASQCTSLYGVVATLAPGSRVRAKIDVVSWGTQSGIMLYMAGRVAQRMDSFDSLYADDVDTIYYGAVDDVKGCECSTLRMVEAWAAMPEY